jgi:hypothetical protein
MLPPRFSIRLENPFFPLLKIFGTCLFKPLKIIFELEKFRFIQNRGVKLYLSQKKIYFNLDSQFLLFARKKWSLK